MPVDGEYRPDRYYIEENESNQSFDIMKRDGLELEPGVLTPERVLSMYSMEYMDPILAMLNAVDRGEFDESEDDDEEEYDESQSSGIIVNSPIIEGDI
jgi:hypothetical protein